MTPAAAVGMGLDRELLYSLYSGSGANAPKPAAGERGHQHFSIAAAKLFVVYPVFVLRDVRV